MEPCCFVRSSVSTFASTFSSCNDCSGSGTVSGYWRKVWSLPWTADSVRGSFSAGAPPALSKRKPPRPLRARQLVSLFSGSFIFCLPPASFSETSKHACSPHFSFFKPIFIPLLPVTGPYLPPLRAALGGRAAWAPFLLFLRRQPLLTLQTSTPKGTGRSAFLLHSHPAPGQLSMLVPLSQAWLLSESPGESFPFSWFGTSLQNCEF